MPKASAYRAPKRVANDRESISSATQLAHFGTRMAKFTHRVSADGASNFSSGLSLPEGSVIISIAAKPALAYAGTDATADLKAGATTIAAPALATTASELLAPTAQAEGELSLEFTNADATEGEITVCVIYADATPFK